MFAEEPFTTSKREELGNTFIKNGIFWTGDFYIYYYKKH
ncbi:hypothetical protein EV201_1281 [Ancylomarina subtilis]|uniref:Uncharacterized protein n=1 Tax=Ancylomarina subtilis TaxID=1639035 RepID=A0A4Q7VK87_9BACT|nr:hypothetical protein EV201_1281 [Ancylomarina subtilis]